MKGSESDRKPKRKQKCSSKSNKMLWELNLFKHNWNESDEESDFINFFHNLF